jgi:Alr-MurF fusion protein
MSILAQIAAACNAKIIGKDAHIVEQIAIDTRQISQPKVTLFVALTHLRDGHDFIESAYNQGVRTFLVRKIKTNTFVDATFLVVEDTQTALQEIATWKRNQFQGEVIAITGSNGKTIVKEWLTSCMSSAFSVCSNPRSFNSQIGVPLSVWPLDTDKHDYGIFEAGVSKEGEMALLEAIIKPDIGVFTILGDAHDDGFKDNQAKLSEKLKLFSGVRKLIACADQPMVFEQIYRYCNLNDIELVNWTFEDNEAVFNIKKGQTEWGTTLLTTQIKDVNVQVEVPFTDPVQLYNAAMTWVTLIAVNLPAKLIENGLKALQTPELRLTLQPGVAGSVLVNDSYSFDLLSLESALQMAHRNEPLRPKILILSDWEQGNPAQAYQKTAALVKQFKVVKVIGIGKTIQGLLSLLHASVKTDYAEETSAFINQFEDHTIENAIVIIKGARSFAFEQIANRLAARVHKTTLEINLTAMADNLAVYRAMIAPKTGIVAMVKASAYGNGSDQVARLLEHQGVAYLGVAYADEGIALRKRGIKLPIMVMNADLDNLDAMGRFRLEPVIFQLSGLRQLARVGQKNISIHLKLDTGMHRLGFEPTDWDKAMQLIESMPWVKVETIFTHLTSSEAPAHTDFTLLQIGLFDQMVADFTSKIGYLPKRHVLNSGGIVRFPQAQYELVRLGIGLYGIDTAQQIQAKLLPVQTLRATISQIKALKAGETVGYNRRGVMQQDGRIATISIGYADGLRRSAGMSKYSVWLYGQLAPTIGNICMDMSMIDISHIAQAKVGDQVEIFGPNRPIQNLANVYDTIPYEVLTDVADRVVRTYYEV